MQYIVAFLQVSGFGHLDAQFMASVLFGVLQMFLQFL